MGSDRSRLGWLFVQFVLFTWFFIQIALWTFAQVVAALTGDPVLDTQLASALVASAGVFLGVRYYVSRYSDYFPVGAFITLTVVVVFFGLLGFWTLAPVALSAAIGFVAAMMMRDRGTASCADSVGPVEQAHQPDNQKVNC